MSKEIFNEGRVVGYSSYETYLKQFFAENGSSSSSPASEREWLASSLGSGSSVLIKLQGLTVDPQTGYGYVQLSLPSDSKLCGASTVVASFFNGEAEFETISSTSGVVSLATKITNYGQLIKNYSNTPRGNIQSINSTNTPLYTLEDVSDNIIDRLKGYMHIVDGIVLQPGEWTATATTPPNDLTSPNLSKSAVIRLKYDSDINIAYVLLSGFLMKTVVAGETGLSGSVDTNSPHDGDFLGPQEFPWAAKIVFTVPTSYIQYFLEKSYSRSLPATADPQIINQTSVIDMGSTDPGTYYQSHFTNARVAISVTDFRSIGEGNAVLTVYQKLSKYPPALYGTYVTEDGDTFINPLDVVAPGNIKVFPNGSAQDLIDWETAHPGTKSMIVNDDGTIQILDSDNQLTYTAQVYTNQINYSNIASGDTKARLVITQAGNVAGYSLSMADAQGNQYTIGADNQSISQMGNTSADLGSLNKLSPSSSNINWAALLDALANNKSIDLLGDNLKYLKAGLNVPVGDTPYLQLPNGLRLYISNTVPTSSTNIPEGSIGIGW